MRRDEAKIDQLDALPLGLRVNVNPWAEQVAPIKTKQLPPVSAREKMPFEVTPDILRSIRAAAAATDGARLALSQ